MILSCNSCSKKFVVPDNAITPTGRLVQCSACGNKWKQFPIKTNEKENAISKPVVKKTATKATTAKKTTSSKKLPSPKKKIVKKKREINLYSPEYLAKKHGIKIDANSSSNKKIYSEKILGPVNAPVFRIKRKFRSRLLIRAKKNSNIQKKLKMILKEIKFSKGMKLTVDVDPVSFN